MDEKKAIQKFMSARRRELLLVKRSFPKFKPGMTTADYIRLYSTGCSGSTVLDYDMAVLNRPAAQLDPSQPECVHELTD